MGESVLQQVEQMRGDYVAATGRPPARIKMGRDFLRAVAVETYGSASRGMSLPAWEAHVVTHALWGHLTLFGMRVQYQGSQGALRG